MTQTEGDPPSSNNTQTLSNFITVETLNEDTTAAMKLATMVFAEKVVEIEERTVFLGDLIKIKKGTREVEGYVRKQAGLRHESRELMSRSDVEEMMISERDIVMDSERDIVMDSERDIVIDTMNNKLRDNMSKGVRKSRELHHLKVRLYWRIK